MAENRPRSSGAFDLRSLSSEDLQRLLPVGPSQIPIWISAAFIGIVAGAIYSIAFAWSLHSEVYGFGPQLAAWAGNGIGFPPVKYARFFGTTGFVVALNALTLWGLYRRLRDLRLVRGREKRPLVAALLRSDVRSLIWSLIILTVLGYIFYKMGYFGRRGSGFDPLEWIVDVYKFYWGFTQEKHPFFRTPSTGYFVPLIIRVGAFAVFVTLATLGIRICTSLGWLLLSRKDSGDAPGDTGDQSPAFLNSLR